MDSAIRGATRPRGVRRPPPALPAPPAAPVGAGSGPRASRPSRGPSRGPATGASAPRRGTAPRGGAAAAERLSHLVGADVPVLGQIPFSQALRNGGDDGKPIVISSENDPAAIAVDEIAVKLTQKKRSLLGVPLKLNT